MKKRCLLIGLLAFSLVFSGCNGQTTGTSSDKSEKTTVSEESESVEGTESDESESTEETVSDESESTEGTESDESKMSDEEFRFLYYESASLAESYVENDSLFSYYLKNETSPKVDSIKMVVVSKCYYWPAGSDEYDYYWYVAGHFYGQDKYGNTKGKYNFEANLCSFDYPTSEYNFHVDTLTVTKSY